MIEVTEDETKWSKSLEDISEICRESCLMTLKHEDVTDEVEVSILLSNNAKIQELNSQFRGKNTPTNVLAFPSADSLTLTLSQRERGQESLADAAHNPPIPFLGDIIIAFEIVAKEANEQGKSLENHVQHLIIHATLHLLGYDHVSEDDRIRMENIEISILSEIGVADPYVSRVN